MDPITERLLLDAGLKTGMRVVDIGCRPGDVATLAAERGHATCARGVGDPTGRTQRRSPMVCQVKSAPTVLSSARVRAPSSAERSNT